MTMMEKLRSDLQFHALQQSIIKLMAEHSFSRAGWDARRSVTSDALARSNVVAHLEGYGAGIFALRALTTILACVDTDEVAAAVQDWLRTPSHAWQPDGAMDEPPGHEPRAQAQDE